MNNIKKIIELTNKIDGFLTIKEGILLYNLAKRCSGKGVIVEIGSWKGRSTVWLGKGSKNGNKVKIYSIDPHTGSLELRQIYGNNIWTLKEFEKNIKMAEIDDIVIPIVKTSQEAAKNWSGKNIELLWIDGSHEEKLVELDYKLWEPYLIDGGIIAFHDTMTGGPKKIVIKYLYKGTKFKNVNFIEGITFAEKSSNLSLKEKITNIYILLLRNLYIFYSFLNRTFFNRKLRLPKIFKIVLKKNTSL